MAGAAALAAFAGLSPSERSSGAKVRRAGGISRIGSERLRRTLFMCALSAKRTNTSLAGFVARMTAAGKAPKVVLVAVARKLLIYAHAVVRTQRPFGSIPEGQLTRLTRNTVSPGDRPQADSRAHGEGRR